MTPLLKLPPEVLANILLRLELADQKQLRCTSWACEQFTTPHVFKEIVFDLEPGGSDGLVSISRCTSLLPHVRAVRLQRRAGLKNFLSFDGWHDSNIYEYTPWHKEDEYETEEVVHTTQPMPRDEWESLDETGRKDLYDNYQSDEKKLEAYISRLAAAVSRMLLPDHIHTTQVQANESDAQRTLCAFIAAVKVLPNISTLAYTPAYESDNWGRTWRNVEFNLGALWDYSSYGSDPDVDALQLFIALRTVSLVPNALRKVELFTLGHAFWTALNLQRLLDWSHRRSPYGVPLSDTVDDGTMSWVDAITDPFAVVKRTEQMTRELVAIERGFSRLTSLNCRIDTKWSDGPNECSIIAYAVSNCLKEAVKLEQLELIYRDDAIFDDGPCTFHDLNRRPIMLRRDDVINYIKVSKTLLLDSAPALQNLRRLHLSLVTGTPHLLRFFDRMHHLRHLQLKYVALLPNGGQWETVLAWLAEHLHLDHVELRALEDISDQRQRLLLCHKSPEWPSDSTGDECYDEYENAIIRYVLRQSSTLPILSPMAYLQRRAQQSSGPLTTPY